MGISDQIDHVTMAIDEMNVFRNHHLTSKFCLVIG